VNYISLTRFIASNVVIPRSKGGADSL